MFKNKIILVTGGTGTVGKEIVSSLLGYSPKVVRIFSRDETKQYEMNKEHWDRKDLRYFIGDIRDKNRLLHAMENVDYVFHTAAMKHVLACEYNPFEALNTNIVGSKNIIEASLECGVGKVILTSTDKATNPCNTMGVSKLFAERLFTAANYYKGKSKTIFSTVRFGNILGSRGSVLPVFKNQIITDKPITLTNHDMTRFVMTIKESLDFVFKATCLAQGGETFISKMPVIRMRDLLEVMVELYATDKNKNNVKIQIIGSQPGEKLHEELMTEEEVGRAVETDDMFILKPQIQEIYMKESTYPRQKTAKISRYSSEDVKPMTKSEIKKLLKQIDATV